MPANAFDRPAPLAARLLILSALTLSGARPLLAQEAASLDEIRVAMDAGDYRGAVGKIDKRLFPGVKDQQDRYTLLMLKGECRLHLMDRMGASAAYKSAAKAASNLEQLAAARANALIVERSTSGRYTPRIGSRDSAGAAFEPIDIVPLDQRKRAMIAYRDELQSQYKSQVEAALRARQLPAIEQVFTRVADMYALELFATGQAGEAGEVMRALGGHAYELTRDEVVRCAGRIDYLTQLANSSSGDGRGWNSGRMGLTSQQRDEVKSMIPYLNKIRDRVTEYRGIAARMGGDQGRWDALVADTVVAIADAESLYNDR